MNKTSTAIARCSVSKLKALLTLVDEGDEQVTSLPAVIADYEQFRILLGELFDGETDSETLLIESIASQAIPLETLRHLKELTKRLIESAPTPGHGNAGKLMYHAVIAAAYRNYGVNVSSQAFGTRLNLYEDLATVLRGDVLASVFRDAVDRYIRAYGQAGPEADRTPDDLMGT